MIFLPGEHALQHNITVRNIGRLVFIGNPSSSPTEVSKIICTDATFTFENILMLEITDLGFHSCTIQLHSSSVIFKNSSFENGTSEYGGAIQAHNSTVKFGVETRFESNRAAVFGGGIYAQESNLTFHRNTTFINNEALERGGGIFVSGSTVSFSDNSSFISNSAEDSGGGVSVWKSSVSFGDNCSFISNSAEHGGGGVDVRGSTVSFGDNSRFISNSAEGYGGGVSVRKSIVSFGGKSSFISNSAEQGGGVSVRRSTVSFVDNSNFICNSAESDGGGIVVWVSTVSFGDNSNFISNSAEQWSEGGGVYVWDSTVSLGDNSNFISNSAEQWGGGVYVRRSTVSLGDNSSFISNSAEGDGGGIVVWVSTVSFGDNSNFISNSAEQWGGGVSVWHSTVSFGDNSSFISNSAEQDAGGVDVRGSTVSFGDNSRFISNSAEQEGGGVYVSKSTVSFSDNSNFISNSAEQWGGGVSVWHSTVSLGDNSSFINNTAERGGGVSVWHSTVSLGDNSSFINNTAERGGGVSVWHSTVSLGDNSSFINNTAERGGGVSVWHSTVSLGDNSSFINNTAERGGGVSVWHSTVSLGDNSSFINNTAERGGGVSVWHSTVSLGDNSSFINNTAERGGGVYVRLSSYVCFGIDSYFTENQASYFGGCVDALDSTLEVGSRSGFMNNAAWYGGCIFVDRCDLTLSKASVFSGNSAVTTNRYNGGSGDAYIWGYGGAIVGSSSNLVFGETQELTNNSAGYGGAIYLTHDSKIYLHQNTFMYFKNNSAQYRGGALFVEDNPFTHCILDSDAQAGVKESCFIQMHGYQTVCTLAYISGPERLDHSIVLQFQDNTAKETGSNLYGGNLDSCGVCSDDTYYVSGGVAFYTWAKTSNSSLISSDPYRVCPCVENQFECNQSEITHEIFPGSTLLLPVVALGQQNGIVPAVIQTYPSDAITLDDLQTTQQTNNTCTNLQYTVRTTSDIDMSKVATLTLYVDEPCSVLGHPLELLVMFKVCPPGFSLSIEGTCQCEQRLDKYEMECDINDKSILRRDSVWIGFDERSDSQSQGLILHPHCPFDYCKPVTESVNFTTNNTDLQCNYNRSGHLCGACTPGYSLAVGSSRCLSCSNKFLALLIPLIFAGLFLVIFMFICKLTVAAGTINGLIFYANIVTANQSVFFPSIETNVVTVFIAWLNLDLGIETCFFDAMDVYSKTWLQFVFPLYIWLLVGLITVICNVSTTAARIIGSTNPIAILATLFLLSYTKILRTFIAAFSFTTLEYPNDETKNVWLYDGNIGYLDKSDGRHIALFLASFLVFLFLFLPYTLFLLFGQCILPRLDLDKLRWLSWANYIRIKSFLDAYHAPYKDRHRYWIGLLLLIRFILFLISATVDIESPQDPHVNLLVVMITSTSMSVWVWNASGGVYKKWYLNVLESSFILNLAFFAAASLYVSKAGGNQAAVFYTSVTVAFSTFFGIIVYHVFQCLRESRAWRNLVRKRNQQNRARDNGWQEVDALADDEMEEMLPTVAPTVTYFDIPTEERREMRPITPPQSPANITDLDEPFDTSQMEDAPGDKKIIPQVAPTMHVDLPADELRNMRPITPPQPQINFTDLREPLDLLTQ